MKCSRIWNDLIYSCLLLGLVVGSFFGLRADTYLRNYIEGFVQDKFEREQDVVLEDYDVVLCTYGGDFTDIRTLPVLLDTILAHEPLAVGIDFLLTDFEYDGEDSTLFSLIQDNDNVVVGYDLSVERDMSISRDNVYPFGLNYDDFKNIGFFNFGAKGTEARYLETYCKYKGPDNNYQGDERTAFWARLWEVASGIPAGELKSNRRFVNYQLDLKEVPAKAIMHHLSPTDSIDASFRDKIVIIGVESPDDFLPTPISYGYHYTMPGVRVVGYATATIGRNENQRNFGDRNRAGIIAIWCLLLSILFKVLHFGECRFCEIIREWANCFQISAAVVLYLTAKYVISPTAEEYWTLFAFWALFVLFAPVVGEVSRNLFEKKKEPNNEELS